jgi:predicted dehydrogenase
LVNSLHARWNQYALRAGKHVLSEKPSATNATEASLVRRRCAGLIRADRRRLPLPASSGEPVHWDMNAADRQMVWTVSGTAGTAVVPSFAVPHLDNRIMITREGSTEEQTLGDQTSYTYQLAALAKTLQTGAEFLIDVDDSVANAELIDEVYRTAWLTPRG